MTDAQQTCAIIIRTEGRSEGVQGEQLSRAQAEEGANGGWIGKILIPLCCDDKWKGGVWVQITADMRYREC
jgi:hypothetical protein